MEEIIFPNGFTSWMETHHEVVAGIVCHYLENPDFNEGTDTLNNYRVVRRWTSEFEELYEGKDWHADGDYWDTIEKFIEEKIKQELANDSNDEGSRRSEDQV